MFLLFFLLLLVPTFSFGQQVSDDYNRQYCQREMNEIIECKKYSKQLTLSDDFDPNNSTRNQLLVSDLQQIIQCTAHRQHQCSTSHLFMEHLVAYVNFVNQARTVVNFCTNGEIFTSMIKECRGSTRYFHKHECEGLDGPGPACVQRAIENSPFCSRYHVGNQFRRWMSLAKEKCLLKQAFVELAEKNGIDTSDNNTF